MKYTKSNLVSILLVFVWQILYAANAQASHIGTDDDTMAQTNPLQIHEIQLYLLEFLSSHEIRQMGSTNRNWHAAVNDYKIIRGPLKAEFDNAIINHRFTVEKLIKFNYSSLNIDNMGTVFSTKPIRKTYFFNPLIDMICTCRSLDGLNYGGYLRCNDTNNLPAICNDINNLDNCRLIFLKEDNINGQIFNLSHDGKIAIGTINEFNKTLNYYQPFIWDERKGLTFLYNPNGDIGSQFKCMGSNGEILGGYIEEIKPEDSKFKKISACLWIAGQHYLLRNIVSQGFTTLQQNLVRGYKWINIECISPNGRYLLVHAIDKYHFKIHF